MESFAACRPKTPGDTSKALDKMDRKILRVIQQDGRISNLKLAETVHLSPTAVLERVKMPHPRGLHPGLRARLNPAKLGASMLVFIEVVLDRTTPDVMNAFRPPCNPRPRILECHWWRADLTT